MKNQFINIDKIIFSENMMSLYADGKKYDIDLNSLKSKRLLNATIQQRQIYEVDSVGEGISWPEIDEDFSVNYLINKSNEGF